MPAVRRQLPKAKDADLKQFITDPEPNQFVIGLPRFRKDRIAYIADLIAELESMSNAAGCATLANILRVAHAEAHQHLARDQITEQADHPALQDH